MSDDVGQWRKGWGPRPEKIDKNAPPIPLPARDRELQPAIRHVVTCMTTGCHGRGRRWTVLAATTTSFKCALCDRRMYWAERPGGMEGGHDAQQAG